MDGSPVGGPGLEERETKAESRSSSWRSSSSGAAGGGGSSSSSSSSSSSGSSGSTWRSSSTSFFLVHSSKVRWKRRGGPFKATIPYMGH